MNAEIKLKNNQDWITIENLTKIVTDSKNYLSDDFSSFIMKPNNYGYTFVGDNVLFTNAIELESVIINN